MMSFPPSLKVKAAAELELRRRRQARERAAPTPVASFLAKTQIKTPQEEGAAAVPFDLWPAQSDIVLPAMEKERLLLILKARQLGISWLACGYVLWLCSQHPGKTVLLFSQGQLEANELIERIRFMHMAYDGPLPALATDNTAELRWANGSGVKSLPATRKAGRSFSASLVIFDEFAFMLYGAPLYAAAKPTVDDGGALWIISSADGQGTAYHQFWQAAQASANGFAPLFLPWQARPSRGADWRDRKLRESFDDPSTVLREYPANAIEAFTAAAGLVYAGVWSDGPDDGSVTTDAAYVPGGGEVLWAVDDGYEGRFDPQLGAFTEGSAPRVFLLVQERRDGRLCVFAEHYAVKTLAEDHIRQVRALGYPDPDYAVVDSAAAELRGRLRDEDVGTFGKPGSIEESIKTLRRMLAPDQHGRRRILVHPDCTHLRREFASYRYDARTGKPVDAHNHGLDALRYLAHHLRYDA